MKKLITGFSIALAAFGASAATITFDDVTPINGPFALENVNPYAGLSWDTFSVLNVHSQPGANGYANGLVSGNYVAFNAGAADSSFSSNDSFNFQSAFLTGAWRNSLKVDISGWRDGTIVNSTTVTLSSLAPSLETFNWTNLDKVSFHSYGGVATPGFDFDTAAFAMDNMTISAVPETGTAAMVMAGLGVIGFVARRRKAVKQA